MLTKRNLCEDLDALLKEISIAFDVDMFAVDSVSGNGIADLQNFIQPGKTVALLESSGEGEITIIGGVAIMQWEHDARDNRHDFGTAMFLGLSSIQTKIAHERSPSL